MAVLSFNGMYVLSKISPTTVDCILLPASLSQLPVAFLTLSWLVIFLSDSSLCIILVRNLQWCVPKCNAYSIFSNM